MIVAIILLVVCIVSLSIIPSMASDEILLDDTFEDSSSSTWSDLTGRGIKTIESEGSGNQYLALTSSNGQYYDYRALKTRISGLLFFDFDIKFTSGDMGVQIRDYTDRSAKGSVMAARIEKYAYYIQYFSENQKYKLLTPSGDWLQLKNVEPWYHIQMVLDTTAHVQSIYLTERVTGTLLGLVENIPMTNPCDSINYFAVSSVEKVCLDNVKITQADITRLQITGETYPKAAGQAMSYQYQCKGVNKQGGQADAGEVVWSLQKPVNGVSISAKTGVLTIQANTPPQPVMIMAVKKNAPSIKGSFLVDIER
jgi:hypothetical protein